MNNNSGSKNDEYDNDDFTESSKNENLDIVKFETFFIDLKQDKWLKSKIKILKNLVVIGIVWVFLFTAFSGVSNLQSSLNNDKGLGTAALSTLYAGFVISCLFLPAGMIKIFGLKLTIIISIITYLVFIAANIYPRWYTLIPAAVLVGFGAGPLWTSVSTYITEISQFYSKLSGETSSVVVSRFFGIFLAFYQSGQIWGNIISSTLLKPQTVKNETGFDTRKFCGANDCPNRVSETKKPNIDTVYLLCGIYLGVGFLSLVTIIFFVNGYKRKSNDISQKKAFSLSLLAVTLKHLKHRYQLLLIPLSLWNGFQRAFLQADFTKSFVTCTKGIEYVGWSLICNGIVTVISCYGFGYVVKYIGRVPCFILAAIINYCMLVTMILWRPNTDQIFILFLIPAFSGVADGVWQTQINALYAVLFIDNKEAAFSSSRLCDSIGQMIAFAYSSYFCTSLKLYLLLVYLTVGILCYGIVEIMEKLKAKKQINVLT